MDTHTLVKRLTEAGVPEAQAEAHMAVFLDMSEHGFATRSDIDRLERRMDGLATREALWEVKRDVETLKTDLAGVKEDLAGVKGDLAGVKTDIIGLKKTFARFEGDFESRMAGVAVAMAGMELRLLVRLGGLIVAVMSAGFAVLEFTLAH